MDKRILKRAVEETADENGVVTPDGVIDAARDPNSLLHEHFEWDDSIAANEHRRAQARALIREVRYVSLDVTETVMRKIEYVRDPRLPAKEQGYIPLDIATKNKKLAADIVIAELNRCTSALNRAGDVAEGLGVNLQIDEMRASIEALKVEVAEAARPKPSARRVVRRGDRPENHPSA